MTRPRSRIAPVVLSLVLAACGAQDSTPTISPMISATPSASAQPSDSVAGEVEPAPGSSSAIYPPNPGEIVVAIDPGHGGCLDWGVPDPSERGMEFSEKALTLDIATRLRDLLEADGVRVVMIRDGDDALAGDDYPPLGCEGPPWRDVNGDGLAGFGSDLPEATRTRDELQARLDLANLSQADALVSIHINAPTEGGERIEVAFSETFYTDETPWGVDVTARLAQLVQDGVVARVDPLADYERGDRGITAHNFYLVAPPLLEPTPERPDPVKQPTRGGLMPVILSEVGSITLRSEHDLLASDDGQDAIASGIFDGIAGFFGERELAARIGLADGTPGQVPATVDGDGPPFWASQIPDGPVRIRLTNTGSADWPSGMRLVAGWEETDQPYLAFAPETLSPLDATVPALAPGASISLVITLPQTPRSRAVAWISLMSGDETLADHGSPALQLSSAAP